MLTLRARAVQPLSPTRAAYLDDAVVVVEGMHVTHVGPHDGRAVDRDLRPAVLLPGFVDGHVHYPQTRIVGSASGPLLPWLTRSTFPEEARFADPDHAAAVARAFVRTLAAAGTTLSFVYGSAHPGAAEALFHALDDGGLRAIAGPVLMDEHSPPELTVPADRALPALEALAERWHGVDEGRLQVAAIPRFALSCSRELMRRAGRIAADRGLWVSSHLSENLDECRVATERFGTADYLTVYEEAGLVHERSVWAHGIHLSSSEWRRLADARAVVAHCPDSNFFLGSGRMPVDTVRRLGLPLVMGSDIAAGRSFKIPRALSSAYDNALATGVELPLTELLWWGTAGGASALGQPGLGRLDVGSEADLVAWEVPPWARDLDSVLGWILFATDAPWARLTLVRGRVVWERPEGPAWPWELP